MDDVAERARRGFEDTRFDWLRTRPRRRLLSVLSILLLLLYAIATLNGYPALTLPALIGWGITLWLLRHATRSIPDLPDEVVDERMRKVRGQIYRQSYITVMALLSLYIATFIVNRVWVKFYDASLMTAVQLQDLSFVLFFAGMMVPSILYAWTERDI
jgi:hypothetical protein